MIVTGSRKASKVLRWVAQAVSKEPQRPALAGVRFEDDTVIATDGYRMHVAPRPDIVVDSHFPVDDMAASYTGKYPAGATFAADLEAVDGSYPDWAGIVPSSNQVAEFVIGVDGKYLAQAVKDLGHVKLTFYGTGSPIRIDPMNGDDDRFVILMPVHLP